MKVASLYHKDGKIVLETDNNALLQLATDTPQDVIVTPYGQDVPPQGIAALRQIVTELRRRNAGPPAPRPVLGIELVEWADRIEAAMKESDNG